MIRSLLNTCLRVGDGRKPTVARLLRTFCTPQAHAAEVATENSGFRPNTMLRQYSCSGCMFLHATAPPAGLARSSEAAWFRQGSSLLRSHASQDARGRIRCGVCDTGNAIPSPAGHENRSACTNGPGHYAGASSATRESSGGRSSIGWEPDQRPPENKKASRWARLFRIWNNRSAGSGGHVGIKARECGVLENTVSRSSHSLRAKVDRGGSPEQF